ncbi:hypothetical protein CXQ80_10965 [Pseudomonas sp. 02C 26]|uniref:ATP-binding protein n=1 Tax=Pseudomonas sp. 02C 26 TaxID=2054914 RepID=UPI000C6CA59E|nr:ATP-binding protein [Pseudomonas sp. 02C 26]AUF96312.1 hypothetical protein CXQ80_10965 [Pseudomonas sp. 02C 26]
MATPSQAKLLAGEILEGEFALLHFSNKHLNLIRRLEQSILHPKGEVILLKGNSGCGITTLLRSLHLRNPETTQMLKGDIYLGYWDFIDHICDAFNIRRGDYRKSVLPANLLRVLSLTKRKVLLIDDLDIYIANQVELDQVFSTIGTLSTKVPEFTFVISTRNKQLLNRFIKFSKLNWWSHDIR